MCKNLVIKRLTFIVILVAIGFIQLPDMILTGMISLCGVGFVSGLLTIIKMCVMPLYWLILITYVLIVFLDTKADKPSVEDATS